MKQGTFEKENFIQSDAKTVINVIGDYSQHHKIHLKAFIEENKKSR